MKIPAVLDSILETLAAEASARGMPLAAVGGCVRDWGLGRPSHDLDLVVEGDPEPLIRLCRSRWGASAQAFGAFGTCRLFLRDGFRIDIARARRESYLSAGALPVVSPARLEEDLWRRDFSINAMAVLLPGRELLDPTGGRDDLRRARLRTLHPDSFRDDPTRIYRAARFAARFSFRLDPPTLRTLLACVAADLPNRLSRQRLRQELWRLLEESAPERSLGLLRRWGALGVWGRGLRFSGAAFRDPDPAVRLGVLAGLQGKNAEGFLEGLRLERGLRRRLLRALDILRERRSPRVPLGDLERRVLLGLRPELPRPALRPVAAGGEDLRRLGLPPGPDYARLLSSLARAQWEGKVATRAQARAWLASRGPIERRRKTS